MSSLVKHPISDFIDLLGICLAILAAMLVTYLILAYAKELSIKDLDKTSIDLVMISPNDPTAMKRYALECKELGIPYLFDPGQQVVRNDPQDIKEGILHAQSVFVNEYEFELIQKHTGLTARQVIDAVDYLVITCGECGSDVYVKDEQFKIPSVPPAHEADPTGVGDAFRGGFLRGLHLGFDWQTAGQMGALAATYCLEQRGTQNHTYTLPEFVRRYRTYFDDQGKLDSLIKSTN